MDEKTLVGALRANGLKVTPQRLAVYQVLCNTNEHPTVDTIYTELHPKYPTMSLATVYKTLEVLTKIGVAQKLTIGEDYFRYDANISSHVHVRCISCGKIEDVVVPNTEQDLLVVENLTNYSIMNKQSFFFGRCPACKK